MRTSTLPALKSVRIRFVSFGATKRETISTRTGKSRNRSRNVLKCCSARIVVGARSSACLPLTATANAARTATSVLPKPTSPQTSRSIGRGASRSSFTASIAASWSGVSRYGKRRLELRQPLVREVVRDSLARLPLRVELDQLAGELADGLPRARLHRLPRLAAELRERGRAGVGADVARDLAELLVRDVEPVLAAEGEQEIVARHARDGLRLEPEELADAVVLVDDVVAGAEVGEGLQRPAAEAALARRAAAEDLVVGQEDEAEVAPDEAAPRGRDRRTGAPAPRAGPRRARARAPRRGGGGSACAAPRRDAGTRRRHAGPSEGAPRARSRPRRGRARRSPAAAPRTRTAGSAGTDRARSRRRARADRGGRPPPRRGARRPAGRRSPAAARAAARGRRERPAADRLLSLLRK